MVRHFMIFAGAITAGAALTACGAGGTASAFGGRASWSRGGTEHAGRPVRTAGPAIYRGPKRRGWMSAAAKSGKVIYVAANSSVQIFPERGGNSKPSGEITEGIDGAYGLCVDGNGNLYVANQDNNTVTKYARGSTSATTVYSQGLSAAALPNRRRATVTCSWATLTTGPSSSI